jgi:hypothetical protein
MAFRGCLIQCAQECGEPSKPGGLICLRNLDRIADCDELPVQSIPLGGWQAEFAEPPAGIGQLPGQDIVVRAWPHNAHSSVPLLGLARARA